MGEILSRLVLEKPNCTHYLFLDADVCFLEDNKLYAMLAELENTPDAFGIGPRMSWDGVEEIPIIHRQENPDICDARLHSCCALIKKYFNIQVRRERNWFIFGKLPVGERGRVYRYLQIDDQSDENPQVETYFVLQNGAAFLLCLIYIRTYRTLERRQRAKTRHPAC
jgi:hypothetical protein